MSFRVKLRLKQMKPLRTDPELLKLLIEAARRKAEDDRKKAYADRPLWPKGNECVPVNDWQRSWREDSTFFLWNGVDPINPSLAV